MIIAIVINSCTNSTNSIIKIMDSIGNWTNFTANGMKSISKVANLGGVNTFWKVCGLRKGMHVHIVCSQAVMK